MHDQAIRRAALELVSAGFNDCDVARRLGLPRTTVRDWRSPRPAQGTPRPLCWRCWQPTRRVVLTAEDYAELLGLYLGDGHISAMPRVDRLHMSLDAAYPRIVADAKALLGRVFPDCSVGSMAADRGATVVVWVYHRHLACLLPQHGPGKKHERAIRLETWQQAHVSAAPWSLLRGCIRSDGCVFVNRTGRYAYLSYEFRNRSADLLEIFASTCRAVGLRPRQYAERVRLDRREDVARLLEHVGLKS